jgi:endonuclease/exonuclease/phosphatase family metal-dependent hydrolase
VRITLRRLFGILFLLLDAALIGAFLLGYAARYIPPWTLWWAELVSIILPYLSLCVLGLLVVLLLARRWKLAAVHTVLALLIAVRFMPVLWSWGQSAGADDLVFLTFNVPSSNALQMAPEDQERVLRDLLAEVQPDVAAFQEASHLYSTFGRSDIRLAAETGNGFTYRFAAPPGEEERWYVGKPLLTHVETGDMEVIFLPDGHMDDDRLYVVRTQFEWQGRQAVHYNVHLQSFSYSSNHPRAVRALNPRTWVERVIMSKDAIIQRGRQAETIRRLIAGETLPIIVTGDFNSTAHSWTFRQISMGLTDAFRAAGRGWGATWHARFPFARIDFVLVSQEWEVVSATVPNVKLSDHKPLAARLRWR